MEFESIIEVTDRAIKSFEDSLRKLENLERDLGKTDEAIKDLDKEISKLEEVRVFLQELAEVARAEIASGLEQIVTLCLQSVFGDGLSFEIEIDTERNSTAVSFYVLNIEGNVRADPKDSMGGTVVDVVAAGLRFGLLKILKPEPVGPIILDEPGKMLSASYRPSFAELIYDLTQMFKKQSIMITHDPYLMQVADHSVYIEKVNGVSKIVERVIS
jgi:DNA repair exonuclease SbcCD ATPase subunit